MDDSWKVHAEIQAFLLGTVGLVDFQKWVGPTARCLSRDTEAGRLIRVIERRLAEYKRGDWTEAQLRSRLAELESTTIGAVRSEQPSWRLDGSDWECMTDTINPVGSPLILADDSELAA